MGHLHRGNAASGHIGSLLFKAAVKIQLQEPLSPSGLILSIFSSAFVFLPLRTPRGPHPVIVFGCWVGFSWQAASRMFPHKKVFNQEDGCLHLILELLLNTINVLSDFIWPRPFKTTFLRTGVDKHEHHALFENSFLYSKNCFCLGVRYSTEPQEHL